MHPLQILLLLTALAAPPLAGEDVLIVNAGSPAIDIDEDHLRDLFLGRRQTWTEGGNVVIAVLRSGPSHDRLLGRLGRTAQQFQVTWKKLVFTGKGAMPMTCADEDELAALVARTPGAIACVDRAKVRPGVKVLAIR